MACLIANTHVVFNRDKKIAFHTKSWGADIHELGGDVFYHGWVHDFAEDTDKEFFEGKGYKFLSREEVLSSL